MSCNCKKPNSLLLTLAILFAIDNVPKFPESGWSLETCLWRMAIFWAIKSAI